VRKVDTTLAPESGQLSCSVQAAAFPSRPDNSGDAARSEGMGLGREERTIGASRSPRSVHLARAWRERRAPDLPRSEHRGTLGSGQRNRQRVWFVRVQPPSHRVLVPPRPRSDVMAVPLSAGPALPGCSVAAAGRGDSDAGSARSCPGAALSLPTPRQAACFHDLTRVHGLDLVGFPIRQ
jgi:hypothetical protein